MWGSAIETCHYPRCFECNLCSPWKWVGTSNIFAPQQLQQRWFWRRSSRSDPDAFRVVPNGQGILCCGCYLASELALAYFLLCISAWKKIFNMFFFPQMIVFLLHNDVLAVYRAELGKFAWNGEEFRRLCIFMMYYDYEKKQKQVWIQEWTAPDTSTKISMPRFEADSSARCDVRALESLTCHMHLIKHPQISDAWVFPFPSHTKTQAIASQKCNECISARPGDGQIKICFADRKDLIVGLVARIEAKHPKHLYIWFHDASGLTSIPSILHFFDVLMIATARQDGHSSRRPCFLDQLATNRSLVCQYDQCCRALVEDSSKMISLELARETFSTWYAEVRRLCIYIYIPVVPGQAGGGSFQSIKKT